MHTRDSVRTQPRPDMQDQDQVRESDYGEDVAETETVAVSTDFEPETGKRLKKAAIIFTTVLGVAFLAVRIDRSMKERNVADLTQEAATAHPTVDVVEAQPAAGVQRLLLPGQTAAWHASTIYARVNGYVGQWFVDIGDRVHKGQVLATIETPELDAELAAAVAQLRSAEAQVGVARAEVEFTKSTYERWRDSPQGVVSEQEREQKKADYDSAVARLKAAQAVVQLDQARVSQYTALSAFKRVTAPYDGVITVRDIDIGNLVTAGSTSATTPLYSVTQNDPMRIFTDVPQSAVADLTQGSIPVDVQTMDGAHHEYESRVARTSLALNPQARTLRVEVDIPNADNQLVPGMYVKVGFGLKPKGLVQVPAAALLFRSGGPQVAVVDTAGRIEFRNVTIARDDGNIVELGTGVSPGEQLVLNVSSQITAGEQVEVHTLSSAPTPATAARR